MNHTLRHVSNHYAAHLFPSTIVSHRLYASGCIEFNRTTGSPSVSQSRIRMRCMLN